MKSRKILSLLLACVLLVSITVPALAFGGTPEYVYFEDSSGTIVAFDMYLVTTNPAMKAAYSSWLSSTSVQKIYVEYLGGEVIELDKTDTKSLKDQMSEAGEEDDVSGNIDTDKRYYVISADEDGKIAVSDAPDGEQTGTIAEPGEEYVEGSDPDPDVLDTAEYDALVIEASAKLELEDDYTEESWTEFITALDECNLELTAEDEGITQTDFDTEAAKIQAALNKLVEKDDPGEGSVVRVAILQGLSTIEFELEEAALLENSDIIVKVGDSTDFDDAVPYAGTLATPTGSQFKITGVDSENLVYEVTLGTALDEGDYVFVDLADSPNTTKAYAYQGSTAAPALTETSAIRDGAKTAVFSFRSDKAGQLHWIAVPDNAQAPTVEQVLAKENYGMVTLLASGTKGISEGANSVGITGLEETLAADLYYATEDMVGNYTPPRTSLATKIDIGAAIKKIIPNGTYKVVAVAPSEVGGEVDMIHDDGSSTITIRSGGVITTYVSTDEGYTKLAAILGTNGAADTTIGVGDEVTIANGLVSHLKISRTAASSPTVALSSNISAKATLELTGPVAANTLTVTGVTSGNVTITGGNVDVKGVIDTNSNVTVTGENAKVTVADNANVTVNAAGVEIISATATKSPNITLGTDEATVKVLGNATLTGNGAKVLLNNTANNNLLVNGGDTLTINDTVVAVIISGTLNKLTTNKASTLAVTVNEGATLGELAINTSCQIETITNLGGAINAVSGAGAITGITAASATGDGSINLANYEKGFNLTPDSSSLTTLKISGGRLAGSPQTISIQDAAGKLDLSEVTAGITLTTANNTASQEIKIGTNTLTVSAAATANYVKVNAEQNGKVIITNGTHYATVNGVSVQPTGATVTITANSADEITVAGTGTVSAVVLDASAALLSSTVSKKVNLSSTLNRGDGVTVTATGQAVVDGVAPTARLIVAGSVGNSADTNDVLNISGAVDISGLTIDLSSNAPVLNAATVDVFIGAKDYSFATINTHAAKITSTTGNITVTGTNTGKVTLVSASGKITVTDNNASGAGSTITTGGDVDLTGATGCAFDITLTNRYKTISFDADNTNIKVAGVTYAVTTAGAAAISVDGNTHTVQMHGDNTDLTIDATGATAPITVVVSGGTASHTYTVTGGATADKILTLKNAATSGVITIAGRYVDITQVNANGGIEASSGTASPANIKAKGGQSVKGSGANKGFYINGVLLTGGSGSTRIATISSDEEKLTISSTGAAGIPVLTVTSDSKFTEIETDAQINSITTMTVMAGATIQVLSLNEGTVVSKLNLYGAIESGYVKLSDANSSIVDVSSGGVLGVNKALNIVKSGTSNAPYISMFEEAKISATFTGAAVSPLTSSGLTVTGSTVEGTATGEGNYVKLAFNNAGNAVAITIDKT